MVWTLLCDTTNLGTIWRRGRCGGCHPQQQSSPWGNIMKHCTDQLSYPFDSTTKLTPIFQWFLFLEFFSVRTKNMIFPDFRNSYDSETFGKQLFKSSREKNVVFSCFERSDVQKFGQQPRQSRLEPPQPTKNWMCHNSPRIYEQSKNNNTYYVSHE